MFFIHITFSFLSLQVSLIYNMQWDLKKTNLKVFVNKVFNLILIIVFCVTSVILVLCCFPCFTAFITFSPLPAPLGTMD